jgi:predicted dehydrogenase
MKNHILSRRKFIRQSIAATASVSVFTIIPRHVLGKGFIPPSDKINLGFIGTGKLIHELFSRFAELDDVMILAGCDVDKKKIQWFKEAVEKFYTEKTGKTDYLNLAKYELFEELLERQDIDAVVVATPDHWHAIASIAAIKAGKDVYCEKPLAHRVKEGRAMVNAARKYDRVVQTGSMQRSWNDFRHACELVRNGYLGEINKVFVNVGDPPVECNLGGEPVPEYLNWDRWLGPAQMRPYNPVLAPPIEDEDWPNWRMYNEFGGGGMTDWGAHMFDIAQWGLGTDETGPVQIFPPKKAKAVRGVKYIFANGVKMIHKDFGRGWAVRFEGTEGTLDISREFLDSKPENIAKLELKDTDKRLYFSDNHYNNWIQSVKNRSRPVADIEIGHRTATICNIGNICYRLRRSLEWDPEKEEFKNDPEANKLLTKDYRTPYIL